MVIDAFHAPALQCVGCLELPSQQPLANGYTMASCMSAPPQLARVAALSGPWPNTFTRAFCQVAAKGMSAIRVFADARNVVEAVEREQHRIQIGGNYEAWHPMEIFGIRQKKSMALGL